MEEFELVLDGLESRLNSGIITLPNSNTFSMFLSQLECRTRKEFVLRIFPPIVDLINRDGIQAINSFVIYDAIIVAFPNINNTTLTEHEHQECLEYTNSYLNIAMIWLSHMIQLAKSKGWNDEDGTLRSVTNFIDSLNDEMNLMIGSNIIPQRTVDFINRSIAKELPINQITADPIIIDEYYYWKYSSDKLKSLNALLIDNRFISETSDLMSGFRSFSPLRSDQKVIWLNSFASCFYLLYKSFGDKENHNSEGIGKIAGKIFHFEGKENNDNNIAGLYSKFQKKLADNKELYIEKKLKTIHSIISTCSR